MSTEITPDEMHEVLTGIMKRNAQIDEANNSVSRMVRRLHNTVVVPDDAPSGDDPSPLADGLDNMLLQRLKAAAKSVTFESETRLFTDTIEEVVALRREVRRLRHIEKQRVEASWAASPDRMGR